MGEPVTIREPYELALQAWVQGQMPTGQRCIFEDEDGPDLTEFATVKVIALPDVGMSQREVIDVGGTDTGVLVNRYRGTVSIQTYGKGARGLLEDIKASFRLPAVELINSQANLALTDFGAITDLSEVAGTRTRPRFQTDGFFNWSCTRTYTPEIIESGTFTAEVNTS